MEKQKQIDKSAWGDGPWQHEPDRVEFEHAGLPCLIVRVPHSGHLCGYAAVPPGHPWHGKDYGDRVAVENRADVATTHTSPIALFIEAHKPDDGMVSLDVLVEAPGGLTYASACKGSVCHVAKPGEPDDVWWFGFDCAHAPDYTPSRGRLWNDAPYDHAHAVAANDAWNVPIYRTVDYVREATCRLADQLAAIGQR